MTAKQVLDKILAWFDELPDIRIETRCAVIEQDHKRDRRVFAHVFHRRGKKICVCHEFADLPLGHQFGIILHEIGHLMSNGGEAEADLWVQDNLGIDLEFKNTLQWADPSEVGL